MAVASSLRLVVCIYICGLQPPHGVEPRTMFDYSGAFGPGMNKNVQSRPLSRADVARWGRMMSVSDEQAQFMEVTYEHFVSRHNEFMDQEAPKYCTQSAKLYELVKAEGSFSPATAALSRVVDQDNVRLRRELELIEQSYIDLIEPILADNQANWVAVLRDEAGRRNARTFRTFGRWANVELRDIWYEFAANAASPAAAEHVEMLLAEHERRLTVLVRRQSDVQFEVRRRVAENAMAMNARQIAGKEGLARHARIMETKADPARRVRQLHEQTIRYMCEALDRSVGAAFVAAAKRAAFPELYPDSGALHPLFNALAADKELPGEIKDALAPMLDAYSDEYRRACDRLESLCEEWGEQAEAGSMAHAPQLLGPALQPLLEKRAQLSSTWRAKLADVIGEEAVARHVRALQTTRHATSTAGTGDRPPGDP